MTLLNLHRIQVYASFLHSTFILTKIIWPAPVRNSYSSQGRGIRIALSPLWIRHSWALIPHPTHTQARRRHQSSWWWLYMAPFTPTPPHNILSPSPVGWSFLIGRDLRCDVHSEKGHLKFKIGDKGSGDAWWLSICCSGGRIWVWILALV